MWGSPALLDEPVQLSGVVVLENDRDVNADGMRRAPEIPHPSLVRGIDGHRRGGDSGQSECQRCTCGGDE